MRIAIAQAYNGIHKELRRKFREKGYEVRLFDIDSARWLDNALRTKAEVFVWFADDKHSQYRLILDRIYFLERYVSKNCFPDTNMYYSFNDKIKQYYILSWLGAPQINTFITFNKDQALQRIKGMDYPVVLKDAHSFGGNGVFKVKDQREMEDIVKKIFSSSGYKGIKDHVYLQRFLPDLDRDLRVITIGDKAVCAYWRIAAGSHWKNNIEQGASVAGENIPPKALELCVDISRRMGYHWMSYDCFLSRGKIYINEFSCNFGVKGATLQGRDIREEQVAYIHNLLS